MSIILLSRVVHCTVGLSQNRRTRNIISLRASSPFGTHARLILGDNSLTAALESRPNPPAAARR